MFYPVKIINSKDRVIKIVSSNTLSKKFWKSFNDSGKFQKKKIRKKCKISYMF